MHLCCVFVFWYYTLLATRYSLYSAIVQKSPFDRHRSSVIKKFAV